MARIVATAFQPIVALPNQAVIGFEALTRWPNAKSLSPEMIFDYAASIGRVGELDRICMTAAIRAALESQLSPGTLLLLNCEPATAHLEAVIGELVERAREKLQLIFEITERDLLAHPQRFSAPGIFVTGVYLALGFDDDSRALAFASSGGSQGDERAAGIY